MKLMHPKIFLGLALQGAKQLSEGAKCPHFQMKQMGVEIVQHLKN